MAHDQAGSALEAGAPVTRRALLRAGGAAALGTALASLELVGPLSHVPTRLAHAAARTGLPDIQFDLNRFIPPAVELNGVKFRFGPVHTVFATAVLKRLPTRHERQILAAALYHIEDAYPFSPEGVFTIVGYGMPYFRRLPKSVVTKHIPRLRGNTRRLAFEEAVPGPTDVHPRNPNVRKHRYHIPLRIERNELLFTLRSDRFANLVDVLRWLQGSNSLRGKAVVSPRLGGFLRFTGSRSMFGQRGLPRRIADRADLPYAWMIHPRSPMWMGFADQQVDGAGPAAITTFAGNNSARLTTAKRGDYFDNASVQHLSHVILDMRQFYTVNEDEPEPGDGGEYVERVQRMFRSTPPPSYGDEFDQYTDGGGPAFLPNENKGPKDAENGARGIGTPRGERRMGHVANIQRVSRAPDGTPMHIRMDGPGYDAIDVPGGHEEPKLHFTAFTPTADLFARMRVAQASLDLEKKYKVDPWNNGLERFLTATRRQNFLVPPRRHRAFPLLEHV